LVWDVGNYVRHGVGVVEGVIELLVQGFEVVVGRYTEGVLNTSDQVREGVLGVGGEGVVLGLDEGGLVPAVDL
jgi:hypothetical protein